MAEHPAWFPYPPDEKFSIVPNAPSYTPNDGSDLRTPMAQKLKDDGVVLCGGFMHPELRRQPGRRLGWARAARPA